MDFKTKYTGVGRKGEGVGVASGNFWVGSCQALLGNYPVPQVCFWSQADRDKAGFGHTLLSVFSKLLGQTPVLGNGSGDMTGLAPLQGLCGRAIYVSPEQPPARRRDPGLPGEPKLPATLSVRETWCPSLALGGRFLLRTRVDQLLVPAH